MVEKITVFGILVIVTISLLLIFTTNDKLQGWLGIESVPFCNDAILVTDNAICRINDYPPCEKPSINQNGMCIIEKQFVCGEKSILKNGQCILDTGMFKES